MARRASCDPSTAPALSLGAHLSRPAQRLLADPSNEFFGTIDTLYYDTGRGLMALLKNVIPLINRRKLGLPSGMLEGGRIYSDTELFVTDMAGKTLERARPNRPPPASEPASTSPLRSRAAWWPPQLLRSYDPLIMPAGYNPQDPAQVDRCPTCEENTVYVRTGVKEVSFIEVDESRIEVVFWLQAGETAPETRLAGWQRSL